ncbi:MAG: ABC transporter substrate-binding protein [Tissierellia bacterium]|nr:ABC transporter substrate-binding protein [Tissierellia bacterium]
MFKKSLLFVLVAALLLGLVGCGGESAKKEEPKVEEEVVDLPSEDIEEEEIEEPATLEIVDMVGRTVVLESPAERVFGTIPTGTILLYTVNPDKLIGWNYELSSGEKAYIDEKYHNLPNLGGAGKDAINAEELLKMDPDLIIMMEEIEDNTTKLADELEAQYKKPVLVLDPALDKMDESYLVLGKALGEEEKTQELAEFCRRALDAVKENLDKIEEPKTVYYAEGDTGLMTEPEGSWHSEIIGMVGGINAADATVIKDQGKTEVSLEQLLLWNPDVIISWGDARGGYYSGILEDDAWSSIKAVEEGEVYEIPNNPFNWFDRPPSSNRILGIRWMANLLYPELYDYDIREEIVEFYDKFYHYEFTGDELEELISTAIRQ